MARGQFDAGDTESIHLGGGHQVHKGVVWFGQVLVHRVHHLLSGMGAGDGQHAGVHLPHQIAAVLGLRSPQTASNDDLAVFCQRLANGVQAFLDGVVNEAAGVDDHQVGTGKGFSGLVTLGAELRQDQLGIGQGFGATQADKAHLGGRRGRGKWFGGRNLAHAPIVPEPKPDPLGSGRRSAFEAKSAQHLLLHLGQHVFGLFVVVAHQALQHR